MLSICHIISSNFFGDSHLKRFWLTGVMDHDEPVVSFSRLKYFASFIGSSLLPSLSSNVLHTSLFIDVQSLVEKFVQLRSNLF